MGNTFQLNLNKAKLQLKIGDITEENLDVIVNAANCKLMPGGGVCGAIHRAAGSKLYEECKKIGYCETGNAVITNGYNLKSNYVIHTVGPIYSGSENDKLLLSSCYHNCLKLAFDKGLHSIGFPSISTGIFGYPVKKASIIALETIIEFLEKYKGLEKVVMILFSENDYNEYINNLKKIRGEK